MKISVLLVALAALSLLVACPKSTAEGGGTALWARAVTAGTGESGFLSVAVDSSGNVYAAGKQTGTGTYTYGAGVSATGTSDHDNVVLVKYGP